MIFKRIPVLCALLTLIIPIAAAEFTLTPDGTDMRWDCVVFAEAWPEGIGADMAELFPGARVIRGVYAVWHPVAGADLPYVLAALSEGGDPVLAGAVNTGDWQGRVMARHFFREGEEFDIGMVPDTVRLGEALGYCPAVIYGGEWYCFRPSPGSVFGFDRYERGKTGSDDVAGDVRAVIRLWPTKGNELAEYSYVTGTGNETVWSGILTEPFDLPELDADTFPRTLPALQEICEPNG